MAGQSTEPVVSEYFGPIIEIIASLAEQSHDNGGGMYSSRLADVYTILFRELENDPETKVMISKIHGVDWQLNRGMLEVWRRGSQYADE